MGGRNVKAPGHTEQEGVGARWGGKELFDLIGKLFLWRKEKAPGMHRTQLSDTGAYGARTMFRRELSSQKWVNG